MDKYRHNWPILGICQGFEVLHWLANDDYFDTLTNVRVRGESRPY
jgi:gamma-glutamyl-gamma-aminobutyrate hydrolase PuuD